MFPARERKIRWGRAAITMAVLSALCLGSCKDAVEKGPDTSKIQVQYTSVRFDKDLYAIDTNHVGEGLVQLKNRYPDFLDYFLDTVMAYGINGSYSDTTKGVREGLRVFLTFKDFKDLEDSIKYHYPDTKATDDKLWEAFKVMKYYFPSFEVPRVIYLNMGLSNWPAFPIDNKTICIGLDMFLGDNFPHYRSIGVPDYMKTHMRDHYIPVAVFTAIYRGGHPFKPEDKTLLDAMIQRGKEQYFLHKIMPGTPDSVLFGFTQQQVDWCKENEALIYNFFIHQNLLYTRNANEVMAYVTDGPYARGFDGVAGPSKTTPGNIGTWMGYKIVSAYMANHSDVTLPALLELQTDAAKVLEEAKYKPK